MTVPARDNERSALAPGVRLGPYEILAPLGAGGMGEVYRARDERLGREVAVKVLHAESSADPDRLRRFEQEAKAAGALNHPNLVAVFDTGRHDGSPYVVFELLDGVTLRQRLGRGPLPARKAVDFAAQIAHGLAAAHEKGIVHRDLKPENLFVTKDGRVKILDFGLAKLRSALDAHAPREEGATASTATGAGVVLGTVGYMSPEQVRGDPADHRSDVFSFGSVLYEMLSGRRAFGGQTAAEVMTAILKEDPPELARPDVPAGLEWVLRRCLERRPEERFQSARDVAFALEGVSSASGSRPSLTPFPTRRRVVLALVAATLALGTLTASFLVGKRAADRTVPSFRRITFRPGIVSSARFDRDGQTIVYSAAWQGQPYEVFLTRQGSAESRPLGFPQARILSLSSAGEMALLVGPQQVWGGRGTLARVPLAGGAPRELLEDVHWADWMPDGSQLAVVREVPDKPGTQAIEFPIGKVLYQSTQGPHSMRVSPGGEQIAFIEGGFYAGGDVVLLDRSGKKTTLSGGWVGIWGLAWSQEGDEVWFTGTRGDQDPALYAVSLSGRERVLVRAPDWLFLQDVSRDGRALLTRNTGRQGILCLLPGQTEERDLGWLDGSKLEALSGDGRTIVFGETRAGGRRTGGVYLRKTDGSPAVRLGDGYPEGLSPDGKWVLAKPTTETHEWVLLPTGPGSPRTLPRGTLTRLFLADWLPDGRRIVFSGAEEGRGSRVWVQEVEGGVPRPITPEGVWTSGLATPDGRFVQGWSTSGYRLYPVDGGAARPLPFVDSGDTPIQWSPDGRLLYVRRHDAWPPEVDRLDATTGHRQRWKTFTPPDPLGIDTILTIAVTADGKSYCYDYTRTVSDLFVVEGLK